MPPTKVDEKRIMEQFKYLGVTELEEVFALKEVTGV